MLLRLWHQIALLRLRPVALIMTQNVDSFEGGRSVVTLEELGLCVTLSNLMPSGGQGTRTLNPLRGT